MKSVKVVLFHILAFGESYTAWEVYHRYVAYQIDQGYGGPWKFLTYINMCVQLFYFLVCILQDAADHMNLQRCSMFIIKLKEIIHASFALPVCLMVFTSFWILYAVDRELVFPKRMDAIVPGWANHLWHTLILITVVNAAVEKVKYPPRKVGLTLVSLFGLLYVGWIKWVGYKSGLYVYPFLAYLSTVGFVLFVAVEFLAAWAFYFLGEYISKRAGVDNQVEQKSDDHSGAKIQ